MQTNWWVNWKDLYKKGKAHFIMGLPRNSFSPQERTTFYTGISAEDIKPVGSFKTRRNWIEKL